MNDTKMEAIDGGRIADGAEEPEPSEDPGGLHVAVRGPAHLLDTDDANQFICGVERGALAAHEVGDDDPISDYPDLCGNCRRVLQSRQEAGA